VYRPYEDAPVGPTRILGLPSTTTAISGHALHRPHLNDHRLVGDWSQKAQTAVQFTFRPDMMPGWVPSFDKGERWTFVTGSPKPKTC
jgi:hypothetical protein